MLDWAYQIKLQHMKEPDLGHLETPHWDDMTANELTEQLQII